MILNGTCAGTVAYTVGSGLGVSNELKIVLNHTVHRLLHLGFIAGIC